MKTFYTGSCGWKNNIKIKFKNIKGQRLENLTCKINQVFLMSNNWWKGWFWHGICRSENQSYPKMYTLYFIIFYYILLYYILILLHIYICTIIDNNK